MNQVPEYITRASEELGLVDIKERYDPDLLAADLAAIALVDPALTSAYEVDNWLVHDTELMATDQERIEVTWRVAEYFAGNAETYIKNNLEGRFAKPVILEGVPDNRRTRRKNSNPSRRSDTRADIDSLEQALHLQGARAVLMLEASHGLWVREEWVKQVTAYCLNYCPELPPDNAEELVEGGVAESDLVELFGRPLPKEIYLGEVVRRHRERYTPDLTEPTLNARSTNLLHLTQLEILRTVVHDLSGVVGSLGGRHSQQAQELMHTHLAALTRDDYLGSISALRSLAETFRGNVPLQRVKRGQPPPRILPPTTRLGFLGLLTPRYTKMAEQLEAVASEMATVYENLGYDLPPSLAFCADLARPASVPERSARPQPVAAQAASAARSRVPQTSEIDEDRIQTYASDFARFREVWNYSNKQRREPRDFKHFERALVQGYKNLAGTAELPPLGSAAGNLVNVLMRLEDIITQVDAAGARTRLSQACGDQALLQREHNAFGPAALRRIHGGSIPAIPDVAGAEQLVRQNWQAFSQAIRELWPGTMVERTHIAEMFAAVFLDPDEGFDQPARHVPAPLTGLVERG